MVEIAALPPTGMIALRGDLADPALAAAVTAATGRSVPAIRRIDGGFEAGAAWMSPDELLLLVPYAEAPARAAELGAALAGTHHLVADVSDARAGFALDGAGAREVLAKGVPVDLHPAAFGPGDLRRTRLGQVAAAFWMPAPERFELVCFRSVAAFVEAWLRQAATPGTLPGFLQGPERDAAAS
jgi:sarcosine oxidase, subunit gamma